MVAVSNHYKERYVERIIGIKDQNEVKRYVTLNEERILEHAQKLYEHSQFVYKGCIGGDKTIKKYYISDDIVLVLANDDSCIITLYKVDFKFPPETNKKVITDLIEEIRSIDEEINEESIRANLEIEELGNSLERLNDELRLLEENIQIMKDCKTMLEEEIKQKRNGVALLHKNKELYAHQLLNWPDFKKDIK